MRLLVAGVDETGGSCIVDEAEVAPSVIDGVPGIAIARLFETCQSPPPLCRPGLGKRLEDRLAPGFVQWFVVSHEPLDGAHEVSPATELHHRNAIDLVVILEGSGELMLGDGPHPVRAGDCIVMPGIDHGLRPGAGGCRLMSFAIGTPPSGSGV